ncbi:MAG: hypothetical protein NTV51_09130 [Verrucomicrobia bacterium]|nr:hypothetical protein [Verrucomicrobiota bacterium]
MTTPPRIFFRPRPRRAATLALVLVLAGCSKTEVTTYRVPKEKDAALPSSMTAAAPAGADLAPSAGVQPAAPGATMAGTAVPTASGPGLTWTAPAAWQAKPFGAMRKGSFTVTGDAGATADLSITAFPGAVGGELANINRWRGQVSLPPIAEADLPAAATRFTANGLAFTVVDLASTDANAQRILGGMTPYEGAMWFFKLTGPDALVAAAKPAFLDFLKTVKVAAPAATP